MARGDEGGQLTRDDRMATVQISVAKLKTPIGTVQVIASGDGVLFLGLPGRHEPRPQGRWLRARVQRHLQTPAMRTALTELDEYFAGKRRRFDVPIDPAGTAFQERVWQAVGAIRFGETASYGEIAAQLGGVHLARAVGAAVGANPIPIIIPCHRVLGSDGSLTGYGGGLRMKVWLLHHEGVLLA